MKSVVMHWPSVLAAGVMAANAHAAFDWKQLPAIPDREGFAGSFAGTSGGVLLVAGGANFPDKRPWEGGTKIWYDRVFALDPSTELRAGAWRDAGELPAANGYGASVQLDDGVLFIGGGDAKRNFAEVWLVKWDGRSAKFEAWPALPKPLAMCAGARAGRTVFVAGGLDRPDATQAQRVFFALDLDHREKGWRELPPWPGAERMLATAGASGGDFFLFSGAKLIVGADGKTSREWLRDAYRYTPGKGWKQIAHLPRVAVAAPSPAGVAGGKLLVIGGDDGAQVSVAPTAHKGFPRDVLAYDPAADAWARAGEVPFSLVTTTLATWRGQMVVPGGEQRPGVRSTAVWAMEVK
ncbi:MAG: galactose oxidase [Verrucomicrobia bacterium]|nr:galactose oxidase [Verrucomicrobiota bacterium]